MSTAGNLTLIFGIFFLLFLMQSVGGYFQIRDYQKAVRRVHKLGNVGIGQKKGGFFTGYLVIIACDSRGIITGAEVMEGLTFLAKFRPKEKIMGRTLVGEHIDVFMEAFRKLDKKQQKRMKGYIQAMDALEMRLYPERRDEEERMKLKVDPELN